MHCRAAEPGERGGGQALLRRGYRCPSSTGSGTPISGAESARDRGRDSVDPDGDLAAAIATAVGESGVDVMLGVGSAHAAVLAAAASSCLRWRLHAVPLRADARGDAAAIAETAASRDGCTESAHHRQRQRDVRGHRHHGRRHLAAGGVSARAGRALTRSRRAAVRDDPPHPGAAFFRSQAEILNAIHQAATVDACSKTPWRASRDRGHGRGSPSGCGRRDWSEFRGQQHLLGENGALHALVSRAGR